MKRKPYVLTSKTLAIILGHKRRQKHENETVRGKPCRVDGNVETLTCRNCNIELKIGDRIVPRRTRISGQHSYHYHWFCAKQKHIV